MTPIACYSRLTDAILTKKEAVDTQMRACALDAKTEKHALALEGGMYTLVLRACLLVGTAEDTETIIRNHKNRLNRVLSEHREGTPPSFLISPERDNAARYFSLSREEQDMCAPYLFAMLFLRHKILPDVKKAYRCAKENNDTAALFDGGIKLGVLNECAAILRDEWKTTGLPAFEV